MFKCSEDVKKEKFAKVQKEIKSRHEVMIERLREAQKRDPDGIWGELLEQALNPLDE